MNKHHLDPRPTLKRLQETHVPPEWTDHTRARILAHIEDESRVSPTPSPSRYFIPRKWSMLVGAAFVLLLVLVPQRQLIGTEWQYRSTTREIANAPHAKAQSIAALAHSQGAIAAFTSDPTSSHTIQQTIRAITLDRQTLDRLALHGEPGKYTSAECLALYQEYDRQLDSLKEAIYAYTLQHQEHQDPDIVLLENTISDATAEASSRINLYPKEGAKLEM